MTPPRAEGPKYRERPAGPWLYYYLLNGFETPGGSRADGTGSGQGAGVSRAAGPLACAPPERCEPDLVRGYRSRRLKQAVLGALFQEYDRTDRRRMSAETPYV